MKKFFSKKTWNFKKIFDKKTWNKKMISILLIAILSSTVIGFFIFYIVKTNINKNVNLEQTSEFEGGDAITFSREDKAFIIQRKQDDAYFLIDNFKAMFLRKLIAAKPASENFHLKYQTNDRDEPTEIKVTYVSEKQNEHFWGYKIYK
jgi:hypothetical protein